MFTVILMLLLPALTTAQEVLVADTLSVQQPDSVRVSDKADTLASPGERDRYELRFGVGGPAMDTSRVNMSHGVPLQKKPSLAFTMSLIVPGTGQIYTGNYFKALAFFGTDVGMLYGILYQHRLYVSNGETVERLVRADADDSVIRYYKRLEAFYKDDRNRLVWWTAGVTLLAAVDAYVEAHLYDFHIDPTLSSTPSGDGVSAGLQITF
jgi:hypothetical protein